VTSRFTAGEELYVRIEGGTMVSLKPMIATS